MRLQRLTNADRRDAQAATFCEGAELLEQGGYRSSGPDRFAGGKQNAALDAVAEEGTAILAEQVVLVAA